MLRGVSHEVAAQPGTDDPDTPTPAVGSWPTIDLGRLGLPPLAWVFVAAALFAAVARLRAVDGAPGEVVPDIVLSAVEAVALVLLAAALLWRAHDAVRTHSLLITGLALAAAPQVILGAYQLWPALRGDVATRSAFDTAWPLLTPLGGVLVTLGLLHLRGVANRLRVLAAIVTIYVGISVASYWVGAGTGTLDAYNVILLVVGPAAAAVAVWVPVAAWLDGDGPPAFWLLLALALPLGLLSRVIMLLGAVYVTSTHSNALFLPTVTATAFLGGVAALLALVAYGRLTPGAPRDDPARGGPTQA